MIATKGRRKLDHDGRRYVWFVKEDDDSCAMILHVISQDKAFNVQYALGQDEENRHVTVLGRDFSGAETGGPWKRFLSPRFDPHSVATPRIVSALIEWCRSDEPRARARYSWGASGSPPDVEGFLKSQQDDRSDAIP